MKNFTKRLKDIAIEMEVATVAKLSSNRGAFDEKMILVVLAILAGLVIFSFVFNDIIPMVKDWVVKNIQKLFNWGA